MTVASQVKQTLTGLKGVQGTLRIYSSQTYDKEMKDVFNEAIFTVEEISKEIEKRIQVLEFQEPQYKGN